MPKTISIASAIESNRVASEVPYLCLLDVQIVDRATRAVTETLRVVRNPEQVTFRGQVYTPAMFDINLQSEVGKYAEVSLTFNDYTQTLQARMEQHGGAIGSKVIFYVVAESNLAAGRADAIEYFEIVGADSSDYVQSFTLGAENVLTMVFPRRRQTRDFCQWRYKSARCGYTGPLPSCDLSLQGPNGCAAHNNTANFGAFPGLNSNGFRYV